MLLAQIFELTFGAIPCVVFVCGQFRARKMKKSQGMLLDINSIIEVFWLYTIHLVDGFDWGNLDHFLILNHSIFWDVCVHVDCQKVLFSDKDHPDWEAGAHAVV